MDGMMQLFSSLIGCFGFSIIFNVKGNKLIFTTLGGGLSWLVYLLMEQYGADVYESSFVSSAVIYFYAELMARLLRTPATVFSVIGTIPLIPGADLYQTMDALMKENIIIFQLEGKKTLLIAASLAAGIVVASACFSLLSHHSSEADDI